LLPCVGSKKLVRIFARCTSGELTFRVIWRFGISKGTSVNGGVPENSSTVGVKGSASIVDVVSSRLNSVVSLARIELIRLMCTSSHCRNSELFSVMARVGLVATGSDATCRPVGMHNLRLFCGRRPLASSVPSSHAFNRLSLGYPKTSHTLESLS
jgi:hypothetical protein